MGDLLFYVWTGGWVVGAGIGALCFWLIDSKSNQLVSSKDNPPEDAMDNHKDQVLLETTCTKCGHTGAITVHWELELQVVPHASLAGFQAKVSTRGDFWPYATCDTNRGGCGHTSRGTRAEQE